MINKYKKILITGYNGLIGSNFIRDSIDKYNFIFLGRSKPLYKNYKWICHDFLNNNDIIKIDDDVDCLIHLAAQPSVQFARKNVSIDCMINLIGTLKLLEMSVHSQIKKILLFSTIDIFGNLKLPDERSDPIIKNPYSLSKYSMEKYARYFRDVHDQDITILRPSFVIGPGMTRNPFFDVVKGFYFNQIELYVSKYSAFDFIHTVDISRALKMIIDSDIRYDALHLCSSILTPLDSIISKLEHYLKKSPPIIYRENGGNRIIKKGMRTIYDFGWKPTEDILEFSMEFYREMTENAKQLPESYRQRGC